LDLVRDEGGSEGVGCEEVITGSSESGASSTEGVEGVGLTVGGEAAQRLDRDLARRDFDGETWGDREVVLALRRGRFVAGEE
jgi:hypothetical protein